MEQLHLTTEEFEAGLAELGDSPRDNGTLEMIVRRPAPLEREVLQQAELDLAGGLVGDNWSTRGSRMTEDGHAHPDMQITMMNSRMLQVFAQDRSRWPLAGDQLIVDLDLSEENLPVGQQVAIGTAVLEVTGVPHTGCAKFTERFGHDAIRFVNSQEGLANRRRGVNMRIVRSGTVAVGDVFTKIDAAG